MWKAFDTYSNKYIFTTVLHVNIKAWRFLNLSFTSAFLSVTLKKLVHLRNKDNELLAYIFDVEWGGWGRQWPLVLLEELIVLPKQSSSVGFYSTVLWVWNLDSKSNHATYQYTQLDKSLGFLDTQFSNLYKEDDNS